MTSRKVVEVVLTLSPKNLRIISKGMLNITKTAIGGLVDRML